MPLHSLLHKLSHPRASAPVFRDRIRTGRSHAALLVENSKARDLAQLREVVLGGLRDASSFQPGVALPTPCSGQQPAEAKLKETAALETKMSLFAQPHTRNCHLYENSTTQFLHVVAAFTSGCAEGDRMLQKYSHFCGAGRTLCEMHCPSLCSPPSQLRQFTESAESSGYAHDVSVGWLRLMNLVSSL